MPMSPSLRRVALLCAWPLLAACQALTPPSPEGVPTLQSMQNRGPLSISPGLADGPSRTKAATTMAGDQARIYKGTGVVVKGIEPGGKLPPGPPVAPGGGGVVLNFEGADLREVIRNILGDILNENYTIDPAVGGTVTIRTSSGIPREALPATL